LIILRLADLSSKSLTTIPHQIFGTFMSFKRVKKFRKNYQVHFVTYVALSAWSAPFFTISRVCCGEFCEFFCYQENAITLASIKQMGWVRHAMLTYKICVTLYNIINITAKANDTTDILQTFR